MSYQDYSSVVPERGLKKNKVGQGLKYWANGFYLLLCVLGISRFASETAKADDMSFSGMEIGQVQVKKPGAVGKDTVIERIMRKYDAKQYQDAAVDFQRVVEGSMRASPAATQTAQFFLAKSLYNLGFYQSSLAVFDEITQAGPTHLHYTDTLQWLAQLASQLPEAAGIIDKVGRYGVDQLKRFDKPESVDFYHQLLYMMGRSKYNQGNFQEAISVFARVPQNSRWIVPARFYEGITHVRMRKAQPAIAAFRSVIDTVDAGKVQGIPEAERMRDLAWLSLARVYYAAANQGEDKPEVGKAIDGRVLGSAIEAWNKIDVSSEYWVDAQFEKAWALFLADEYSRSLGNLHTVGSPYFENYHYPEALVLKSVVFFANCQMDNAAATVAQFHDRYDPLKTELEAVLARYPDNTQFFEFLKRVRAGKASLSPRVEPVVKSAFSDRTLLRHIEYHRLLEEEERRLAQSSPGFKKSTIGSRVAQDISLAKSFAVDQAGDLARTRYSRVIEELQDLMNQVDTVDLEIATYQRGQLSQELQQQQLEAKRRGHGRVEVDEEHQMWPFQGEYWRDELGYYRQEVTSRCGR